MQDDIPGKLLRGAYSALLYLLIPVTLYHLVWRGFRQPAYFQRWNERYAAYAKPQPTGVIWVHAVSVGEVNAVAPLVDALLRKYPQRTVLMTCVTPTGSERIRARWGDAVAHVYLPYDLPGMVQRFLQRHRPCIALIVETELWPNLLFGCREQQVPAYIVNGRLSARSLRGYRVLRPLLARALRTLRNVAAQSTEDGRRFVRLGAPREAIVVTGNLKHEIPPDPGAPAFARVLRASAGARLTWIAASTHPDEEAAVLRMHARLRQRWPELLLLWAPRHPERFRAVAQQAVAAGWRVATRQLTRLPDAHDAIFVIDTLGELMRFYACAQVAFVGGSLQPVGGHNLLEPAAMGCAIVTGPHLHNFAEIARQLHAGQALRIGNDEQAVTDALAELLADAPLRLRMGEAGLRLVEAGRGALQRTLALIEPDLAAADGVSAERASVAP